VTPLSARGLRPSHVVGQKSSSRLRMTSGRQLIVYCVRSSLLVFFDRWELVTPKLCTGADIEVDTQRMAGIISVTVLSLF